MSESAPEPKNNAVLSNPQILIAVITGIVSVVVAIVGITPQLAKNNEATHTPTPLAGLVVTFTHTPPASTITPTPTIGATSAPQSVDPSPEPSRTPTPSATSAPVEAQAPNVRFFHNNRSFTALNLSSRRISLNEVVFTGGDGRWAASDWGPVYQTMNSGDCLRMRDQNSNQQNPPSECGNLLGLVLVGDSAIFWRDDDGFTVSQNGTILATCPQDVEICDVFIPQP